MGQAQRTAEEQEVFVRVLSQMHSCYCYSDAVIHLHSNPPFEEGEMRVATVDMGEVEVVQVGPIVQVVGLRGKNELDGLTAFDIICSIDEVIISSVKQVLSKTCAVRYLRRPFGRVNIIPVEERGWVYLERFITMVKMAMIEHDQIGNCVFANSDLT